MVTKRISLFRAAILLLGVLSLTTLCLPGAVHGQGGSSPLSARFESPSLEVTAGDPGKIDGIFVGGWSRKTADKVEVLFPMSDASGVMGMRGAIKVSPARVSIAPASMSGNEFYISLTWTAGADAMEQMFTIPVIVRQSGAGEVELSLPVRIHAGAGASMDGVPVGTGTTVKHPWSGKPVVAAKTSGKFATFIDTLEKAVRSSQDAAKLSEIVAGSPDAARGAFDELLPVLEKEMVVTGTGESPVVTETSEDVFVVDTMVSTIASTFEEKLNDGSLRRRYNRMLEKKLGGHTPSAPPAGLLGTWSSAEQLPGGALLETYSFREDGTFDYSLLKTSAPPMSVMYEGRYEVLETTILVTDLKGKGSGLKGAALKEKELVYQLKPDGRFLTIPSLHATTSDNYWKDFEKYQK